MRIKLRSLLLVVVLSIGCILIPENKVIASSNDNQLMQIGDGMSAYQSEESIGYIQVMPRGKYLQTGFSAINKAGEGLLTAGGGTFAQMVVDDIKVDVDVEMFDGGKWENIKSWSESKKKDSAVITSKTFEAESGLYRVKCLHTANSESSGSTTDLFYLD